MQCAAQALMHAMQILLVLPVAAASTSGDQAPYMHAMHAPGTRQRSRSQRARACPGTPGSSSASPASRVRCRGARTRLRPGAAKGAMYNASAFTPHRLT